MHPVLFFATLLDPRFKLDPNLSEADKNAVKEAIVSLMVKQVADNVADAPNTLAATAAAAPPGNARVRFLALLQQQPAQAPQVALNHTTQQSAKYSVLW